MPLLTSYYQLLDLACIVLQDLQLVIILNELPRAPLKCTVSFAVLSILTERAILYHIHNAK